METIDMGEFRDVAERFIACRHNTCNECSFRDACAEDLRMNAKPLTDRVCDILEVVLTRLDEQSQMSVDDFIALLKGE